MSDESTSAVADNSTPQRYPGRASIAAAFIALLSPLVAVLIWWSSAYLSVYLDLHAGYGAINHSKIAGASLLWANTSFWVRAGYVIFGVPTLPVAGWLWVKTWRTGSFSYLEAMLVTAMIVSGLSLLVSAMRQDPFARPSFGFVSIVVAVAIAVVICRWLIERIGVLPRAGKSC